MRFHAFMSMAVAAVATFGTGCASTRSAQPAPAAPAATAPAATAPASEHSMMGGMCPMQVPGTTVTAADVEGGVALSFTTSTGDVADLRQRVRRMAEMHSQMHGRMHGQGGMMPAATTSVEDITGGARVILRPGDPAQLEALREHARMQAARTAQGECPMMPPRPSPGGAEHGAHHPPK